uniref:Uncharacterized protein n=1 Tax=Anguilla anguilla TaxID=7936 RepID=A0A0E9T8Y7_ANGAN
MRRRVVESGTLMTKSSCVEMFCTVPEGGRFVTPPEFLLCSL